MADNLPDHCTRQGAEKIKERLEQWWRDHGRPDVQFEVIQVQEGRGKPTGWGVRCKTVLGIPRRLPRTLIWVLFLAWHTLWTAPARPVAPLQMDMPVLTMGNF